MKCQCCGSEMVLFMNFKKTYVCHGCGHVYWNWNKTQDEIKKFYDSWRNNEKPIAKQKRIKWSKNICEFIDSACKIKNNDSILEIGSFDGIMSKHLHYFFQDCELHLNELDTSSYEKYLAKNFKNTYNCNFLEMKGKFDVLVAIDVLEHFDNLKSFYDKVVELEINTLILQVPFKRPLRGDIDKRDFHPHYHLFSKNSIQKLFSDGYVMTNWKNTTHDFSAKGPEQICIFKRRRNATV